MFRIVLFKQVLPNADKDRSQPEKTQIIFLTLSLIIHSNIVTNNTKLELLNHGNLICCTFIQWIYEGGGGEHVAVRQTSFNTPNKFSQICFIQFNPCYSEFVIIFENRNSKFVSHSFHHLIRSKLYFIQVFEIVPNILARSKSFMTHLYF